jgi:hypothetical protein
MKAGSLAVHSSRLPLSPATLTPHCTAAFAYHSKPCMCQERFQTVPPTQTRNRHQSTNSNHDGLPLKQHSMTKHSVVLAAGSHSKSRRAPRSMTSSLPARTPAHRLRGKKRESGNADSNNCSCIRWFWSKHHSKTVVQSHQEEFPGTMLPPSSLCAQKACGIPAQLPKAG